MATEIQITVCRQAKGKLKNQTPRQDWDSDFSVVLSPIDGTSLQTFNSLQR